MNKEIKEITLKQLKRRKDILTHKGNFNNLFLRSSIRELKRELQTRESKYTVGAGIGVSVEVNPDTHNELLRKQEQRLEKNLKEIAELEKAIEYIEKL